MSRMASLDGLTHAFGMTDEVWARHASGWSVWTRWATGWLVFLALWSHVWWGWPLALLALALVAFWMWLNPRIFPKPASTDNWAAKATFGERVWLNRKAVAIPRHHARAALLLSLLAAVGTLIGLYGAISARIWPTVLGVFVMYAGKAWFCDRMVWLYADMKDSDPVYRSWLY